MKQKRILLGVLALIAIALAGFVIWAAFPAGPDEEAMQALHSDEVVNVTLLPGQIIFRPAQGTVDVGLVFYPGGRVDYRSYAPPLRAIAAEGYWVALVSMPLNLAVFDPNRANAVIDAHPEIQHWAVGGHSLGGAMAAHYAFYYPQRVQGLVLWAAYPSGDNSLAQEDTLTVVSIFASRDGLATPGKIAESQPLLPATTRFFEIAGGNHAQFGNYGIQAGDLPATLSRTEQQRQTVAAVVALLSQLGE